VAYFISLNRCISSAGMQFWNLGCDNPAGGEVGTGSLTISSFVPPFDIQVAIVELATVLLIRCMWEVPGSYPSMGTEYTDSYLMFYLTHFWHVLVILYHKMGPSSRFEVFAAVTLKITVFRYLTPCSSPGILPPSSLGRRLHGVISQKTMPFETIILSFPIRHSQPPYN